MRSSSAAAAAPVLALAGLLPPSRAINSQIAYYAKRDAEYCHAESFALGTCLGTQQQKRSDLSDVQILQCLQCSGRFRGDESCEELKALNDVQNGNGTEATIDWEDSFCETYSICVERNCPTECLREQDAWLECLILELDCDWRCEGAVWLNADGRMGRSGGRGRAAGRTGLLGVASLALAVSWHI